jgi:hypothetical protein
MNGWLAAFGSLAGLKLPTARRWRVAACGRAMTALAKITGE